ncbi:MAG TPA: hypothetical protein VEQ41_02250 [Solirubrobacterales bacterium]|nr:hypothetical protein [Solirubrobacterales bacterium]
MKRLKVGPELKMPKLGSSSFKAPPFMADVYHDLRERRLLPLVALVVVAILAVPILLGGSADTEPLPPTGESVTGGELEATSGETLTVVQATPGLRDYRKRLRGRTPNDPFKQKYTSLPPDAKLQSTVETSPTSSTGDASEVSVTDEGDTVTVEVDEDGGGSAGVGAPSAGGGSSGGSDSRPAPAAGQFYAYRPDVRFGVAGSGGLRAYPDLPIGSLLPKEKPVLFFIGSTEEGDRVVFDVSAEVMLVKGEGKCIGGRQSCGLLFMGPGDAVTLLTEIPGRTFQLAVDSIDFVPVDRSKAAGSSAAGAPQVPGLSQNFSK